MSRFAGMFPPKKSGKKVDPSAFVKKPAGLKGVSLFKSERQRRFLWMTHPKLAHLWAHGKHAGKKNAGEPVSDADLAKARKQRGKLRRSRGGYY